MRLPAATPGEALFYGYSTFVFPNNFLLWLRMIYSARGGLSLVRSPKLIVDSPKLIIDEREFPLDFDCNNVRKRLKFNTPL
jgi:hypothetical protein